MTDANTTIESVLQEQRVFEPPADTAAKARIGSLEAYRAMADAAKNDPDAFCCLLYTSPSPRDLG